MEYFVDAQIRFKGDCDLEVVDKAIKEQLEGEDNYILEVPEENKLTVTLEHGFDFYSVEPLVKAVLSTGLKKFGRDKLIAYQTCAGCYFKNYVTKAGEFWDFCGDVAY